MLLRSRRADTCNRSIALSSPCSKANRRRSGLGHKKVLQPGMSCCHPSDRIAVQKSNLSFYPLSVCSARKLGLSRLERGLQAGGGEGAALVLSGCLHVGQWMRSEAPGSLWFLPRQDGHDRIDLRPTGRCCLAISIFDCRA